MTREFKSEELEMFFLKTEDGYLKEKGNPDEYSIEKGVEGAELFTEVEAMETINENPELNICMERVGDVISTEEFEIIEG